MNLELTLENVDLFASHYPMTWFGFSALREGRLPLWNPWQFAGEPFLAAYYGGLFYPLNAIYLVTSVPLGMEISGVLHMLLAAGGMAALARRLRFDWPGALVAAFTFAWSGWFVFSTNQPRILAAIAWLPWTVWLVDRVFAGERHAGLALALVVAAQLLIGDGEHVLHGLLAGALCAVLRLGELAARGAWRDACVRGALCAGALAAAALLTAFQLLPTLELVRATARADGGFDVLHAIGSGAYTSALFLGQAVDATGWVGVGVLPLVAALLALGRGRGALPWLLGAAAALIGAQLVLGGALFRLYHELPFAQLFRRPYKFLDVYAFGQALLAGLAVSRLGDGVNATRRELWSDVRWLAALALGALLLVLLHDADRTNRAFAALLLALGVYGAVNAGAPRRAAIALGGGRPAREPVLRLLQHVRASRAAARGVRRAARAVRGGACARRPIPRVSIAASVGHTGLLAQAGHVEPGGRQQRLRAARARALQGILRRRLALALARWALQRALPTGGRHRNGVCSISPARATTWCAAARRPRRA